MNHLLFPAQIVCTLLVGMGTLPAAESKLATPEEQRLTILMVDGSG